MNEEELQSMIVRVKGDSSHYEEALHTAQEATNRFVESVVRVGEAFGIERLMHGSFEAFEAFEANHLRLKATLEAEGRDVAHVTEEYEGYAEALDKVSMLTKAQSMNLLRSAEEYRLTGAAANQAVREAAALSEMTGHSAEAMLRLSAAMARGDFATAERFGRLVPALRGIREPAEFAKKYLELVQAGTKVMGEQADGAGGKLKRLNEAWDAMKIKLGEVISDGLKPFLDHALRIADLMKDLPAEFYEWAAGIGAALVGLLLLGPALSLLKVAAGPVISLVSGVFDIATVTISTAAWVAWTAVVLLAKGAVWLLNVAVAVFNVETMVPALVTLVAVGAALSVLTLAATGAYNAVQVLGAVFSTLSSTAGPFGAVTKMADEWYERMKRIVEVAQTDLPGAWLLVQKGFTLAVNQIQDLWPPLWNFVIKGWRISTDLVTKTMEYTFYAVFLRMSAAFGRMMADVVEVASPYLAHLMRQTADKRDEMAKTFTSDLLPRAAMSAAQQFKKLMDDFKITESEGTKKAMEEFENADRFVKVREAFRKAFKKGAEEAKHESGIGEVNITPKFDSAAWNSAEMRTRVTEWRDRMGLATVGAGEALAKQRKAPDNQPVKPGDDFGGGEWTVRPDPGRDYEQKRFDIDGLRISQDILEVLKEIKQQGQDVPRIAGSDTGSGVF